MCLKTTSSGIEYLDFLESKIEYILIILSRIESKLDEIIPILTNTKLNEDVNRKISLWLKSTSKGSQEKK